MSKRVRIYTAEDVSAHRSTGSCWISRKGKVYDVTAFLPDHPGGDDFILKYAGQAVDDAMADPNEHQHSDSAFEMMEEYFVGRLGSDETIVDAGACLEIRQSFKSQRVRRHSRLGSHG
jgi:4-hydroxysphinganine ceramide fatty acyl 2-hydroxylase